MNWILRNGRSRALASAAHRPGLGQAGHALDQDVASGQEGDDEPLQQAPLADDLSLDPLDEPQQSRLDLGDCGMRMFGIIDRHQTR